MVRRDTVIDDELCVFMTADVGIQQGEFFEQNLPCRKPFGIGFLAFVRADLGCRFVAFSPGGQKNDSRQ